MSDERNNKRTSPRHQQVEDDESDLPEHTISMRSALQQCIQLSESLALMTSCKETPYVVQVDSKMKQKADTLNDRRQQCYIEFWKNLKGFRNGGTMIPIISADEITSPQKFREEFHCQNLPCLIQYEVSETAAAEIQPFAYVNKKWRTGNHQEINRDWFVEHVGADTQVPLRYSRNSTSLDSEGRATECETRQMSMSEWIQMLNKSDTDQEVSYYLKDWHLVSLLNETEKDVRQNNPVYMCPDIFQYDLLNPFLSAFTKGDYKFCYWGPQRSKTLRHSDVLHSFSWSYNVHGTKRWTFFSSDDDDRQFTVLQKAGQAMFVPCTWQHEVENMEETISINHNWITVANIDKTWECLLMEMKEIEHELEGWGIIQGNESYLESCESMLRGCVGLNATAFFAMTLLRLLELLVIATKPQTTKETGEGTIDHSSDELAFDCYRLVRMIQLMMKNKYVQLEKRIEAVTMSKELAEDSFKVASTAFSLVCIRYE
jgi:hypothetical protein